jgi:hypothetical protein
MQRTTDAYRKISINNLVLKVNNNPYEIVELCIYPLDITISEISFWCNNKLIVVQKVKNSDLNIVLFLFLDNRKFLSVL